MIDGLAGAYGGLSADLAANLNLGEGVPLISFTPSALDALKDNRIVPVVIFNPTAWALNASVDLTLPIAQVAPYVAPDTPPLPFSVSPPCPFRPEGYVLSTTVALPPLGARVLFLVPDKTLEEPRLTEFDEGGGNLILESDTYAVEIDAATGRIARVTNRANGRDLAVGAEWMFYRGSVGGDGSDQASGAYILRFGGGGGSESWQDERDFCARFFD
jgi:hypothetical protein